MHPVLTRKDSVHAGGGHPGADRKTSCTDELLAFKTSLTTRRSQARFTKARTRGRVRVKGEVRSLKERRVYQLHRSAGRLRNGGLRRGRPAGRARGSGDFQRACLIGLICRRAWRAASSRATWLVFLPAWTDDSSGRRDVSAALLPAVARRFTSAWPARKLSANARIFPDGAHGRGAKQSASNSVISTAPRDVTFVGSTRAEQHRSRGMSLRGVVRCKAVIPVG